MSDSGGTPSLHAPRPQTLPPGAARPQPPGPTAAAGNWLLATCTRTFTRTSPWNMHTTAVSHRQTQRHLVPGVGPDTGTIHAPRRVPSRVPPSRTAPLETHTHSVHVTRWRTHAFSVSHTPHGSTETLIFSRGRDTCFYSQPVGVTHSPPHALPSPCIYDHPVWTRHQPRPLCASCWPGFLRAFLQGQGGRPGWRWICTPSWLTHLSHWEWLAWGDPEFTVSTGASQAMGVGHGAWPGGRAR